MTLNVGDVERIDEPSAEQVRHFLRFMPPHSPFITFRGQDSSVTTLAICQGSSQIIDSDSATGIQWYKDGVAISGATHQSYTATTSGSYNAQLNALGCHSQFGTAITVTVVDYPSTPTITGATDQACPEQPLTLTANASGAGHSRRRPERSRGAFVDATRQVPRLRSGRRSSYRATQAS